MKGVVLGAVIPLVLAMISMVAKPSLAMSCGDVILNTGTCMMYLTGNQPEPLDSCCDGVCHLKSLEATTVDRRMACNCMRVTAERFKGFRYDLIDTLAEICSCSLPFPTDLSLCDQIP